VTELSQAALVGLSQWIDAGNADRDPEALTLHRLIKLTEESGEVVTATIGALGANPRKGVTNTFEKVLDELLDVAITALGAYEHIDGHQGRALSELEGKIVRVAERAGVVTTTRDPSVQEPEHMNLAPITDDDLLRIANRPGGINEQLRAAMDARDHEDGSADRG